jgi:carboxylesterase type B
MTPLSVLFLHLSATLAAAAVFSNGTNSIGQFPTATIDSGVIIGTTTVLPSVTSVVNKFFGIPYAAPPTRFLPSEQPQPWNSTFDATTKSDSACYQNYIYSNDTKDNLLKLVIGPGSAPEETEDCLTLDLFAPATASNDTGRAVLFWVYGGSYRTGSNSNINYDGTSLAANQDVILVSPNYRLNVHGFPDNPELEAPNQNLG